MVENPLAFNFSIHARFAMRSMKPGRSSKVLAAASRRHPTRSRRKQSWPSAS
jgi:hypothetical protein